MAQRTALNQTMRAGLVSKILLGQLVDDLYFCVLFCHFFNLFLFHLWLLVAGNWQLTSALSPILQYFQNSARVGVMEGHIVMTRVDFINSGPCRPVDRQRFLLLLNRSQVVLLDIVVVQMVEG